MRVFTRTVQDVMTHKVISALPSATLQEVAALMTENKCGEIPVCEQSGKVVGVVTDRDVTCRGVARGLPPATPVRDIMTTPAVTVDEDAPLSKALFLMQEKNVRRLPVTDLGGRLVGILSQIDVATRSSAVDAGKLLAEAGRHQH